MYPLLFIVVLFLPFSAHALDKKTLDRIGEQIFANECSKSTEKLTLWNANEEFPSLGIGHFIWYVKGKEQRFEEIFPTFVIYLQKQGVTVPAWICGSCPWETREQFYADFQGSRMKSLREILNGTKAEQVNFIVERMEKGMAQLGPKPILDKLKQSARGTYVLVDYINFKGLGINPMERYQGQGWGLVQVLEGIPTDSTDIVKDFVLSAKKVLALRIKNSPAERNEGRWLPGWYSRLETYLNF